jgi:phenylalanyl-tRNA synthetase beta chain
MKIPLSLIRSYLELDEPLPVISETLTLLGIEVDQIENETPHFAKVISAEVKSTEPHPDSDHLTLAQVFDGERTLSIVCGAKNCRPRLKVALAQVGATLYDDKKQRRLIVETKIRGIVSQGMLCSADELGIPGSSDGILELPSDIPNGQDLIELLWDPVLELSMTPNLGHCLSALGIARELSAAFRKPLRHTKFTLKESLALSIEDRLEAAIQNPEQCPRYLCRLIENVKIGPSPFWLRQTLLACGMRPINNVVDATNYILLKTGQPLHAFDYDCIEGKVLSVQSCESSQPFIGLDGIGRDLPAGALVIADAQKPLAIAGIMGGANSSVSEKTRTVVIEAAHFDPLMIRKTSRTLKLITESSQRFEKGIDWYAIPGALNEACHLIAELCHGTIAKGAIDIQAKLPSLREAELRGDRTNQILGLQLSLSEMEGCLQRIGCKTHAKDGKTLKVKIPSFRNDLGEEIDLIEEVARIYGYNNIEKKIPLCTVSRIPHDPQFIFERDVRRRLAALGLQEIVTCNLISPRLASLLPAQDQLRALHSKSEDYSILRSSLLPSLLEVVKTNLDQKNLALQAFETGRIHLKQNGAPVEIPMLGVVMYGKTRPHHWDRKPADIDFYDLKGVLEVLFEGLSISGIYFQGGAHDSFHPNRQADLHIDGLIVGSLGEIHPLLLAKLDIKQRIFFAELNLAHLLKRRASHVRCQPLPLYPSTERDWTVTLPRKLQCETLFEMIRSFHSPLFEKAELVDLYLMKQEAGTLHNATVRFTYRDQLKTISFEEAEAVHAKLMNHVVQAIERIPPIGE